MLKRLINFSLQPYMMRKTYGTTAKCIWNFSKLNVWNYIALLLIVDKYPALMIKANYIKLIIPPSKIIITTTTTAIIIIIIITNPSR